MIDVTRMVLHRVEYLLLLSTGDDRKLSREAYIVQVCVSLSIFHEAVYPIAIKKLARRSGLFFSLALFLVSIHT